MFSFCLGKIFNKYYVWNDGKQGLNALFWRPLKDTHNLFKKKNEQTVQYNVFKVQLLV